MARACASATASSPVPFRMQYQASRTDGPATAASQAGVAGQTHDRTVVGGPAHGIAWLVIAVIILRFHNSRWPRSASCQGLAGPWRASEIVLASEMRPARLGQDEAQRGRSRQTGNQLRTG